MHYGGDYNPEQWNDEVWHDDVRLMREAGVTLVSLGIFAWARIQPDEHTFDFDWLDRVIDLLHENGIAVDLATATASPPAWALTAYPGILPEDENGARYWQGSRQHYAPASPDYRRLAAALVTAIVERYHAHPAVVVWHVNNEYGCHVHRDYSDNAAVAFRAWLERRYGSIEALNAAWGTAFWSQAYTSFDQIVPPRKAPTSHNPTGLLDFKRYSSDTLLELFVMERDIIKAAGATQPVTTNFMGAFPAADYWSWAPELDLISDDNYADPHDPRSFRGAAFTRDLMRSLKPEVPWMLMEQATSAVNWRASNAPKAPGQLAALSMQAVGRGADGILFFQWRQSTRGSEKFHSAMVPHAGTGTRTWREVVELGASLKALPTLPAQQRVHGERRQRVALVFDWQNGWALENPDHPTVLDYGALVQRWYSALHRQHLMVDIVTTESDLADYPLVVLPHQYLLTDAGAANLAGYVERGGHLLVTAFSDVVDGDDAFRPGGFQVGLRAITGVTVDDFGALVAPDAPASEPGARAVGVDAPFGPMTGEHLAEELRLLDDLPGPAEVVASYTDGRLAGSPALTSRAAGLGRAHHLGTVPDDEGMRAVTEWAARLAGVRPVVEGLSEWVEAARRGDVVTVINHGSESAEATVSGAVVASMGASVSASRASAGLHDLESTLSLQPFGWAMVRTTSNGEHPA